MAEKDLSPWMKVLNNIPSTYYSNYWAGIYFSVILTHLPWFCFMETKIRHLINSSM